MNRQAIVRVMLLVSILLLGLLAVNKTQAWLLAETEQRANQFTVGKVTHEIEEEFDTTIKTNVTVVNTGNTESFIRVKIVPQWLDQAGGNIGLVADDTYDITFNTSDWVEREGFWYHKQPVAAGAKSTILVEKAQPKKTLDAIYAGKVFNLQVMSQSVQATPKEAVTELWGFEPNKN